MTEVVKKRKRRNEKVVGQVFGRLTVIEETGPKSKGRQIHRSVKCLCSCGNTVNTFLCDLRSGNTKSCGCFKRDKTRERLTVHGMRNDPLYGVWNSMKKRCNNPNNKYFCNYGGRGITVSDEWNDSFYTFYIDMNIGYKKGLNIDRIDNNKGYSKENCRWVTRKENNRNTRSNIRLIPGDSRCISQLAEDTGIGRDLLRYRHRVGYRDILAPVRRIQPKMRYVAFGESKYLHEWAREWSIHLSTMHVHSKRDGFDLEDYLLSSVGL